jgi:CRISPR-associated protein Csd1
MTILSSLAALYDRLAEQGEVPRDGWSSEQISFAIVLDAAGDIVRVADKRDVSGKKPRAVPMNVPKPEGRTSGVKPFLFWDKTAYVLGVTTVKGKDPNGADVLGIGQGKRTAAEHAAFADAHLNRLAGATDPALIAFRKFIEAWTPEDFVAPRFTQEMVDANFVFAFEHDGREVFIHDLPAARALLSSVTGAEAGAEDIQCLVTGVRAPLARLHPTIKGVMGAQSSGASLVSFNSDAYESLGKSQGGNAPVSAQAAFAYGAALNALLARRRDGGTERHIRVGDMTVVFWVEAPSPEVSNWQEMLTAQALNPPGQEDEARTLHAAIRDVAEGRGGGDPKLDPETRVFMLGLAPNAARLSVRFWAPGRFGDFAENVQRFWDDLKIEPAPWKGPPPAWALLYETALQRKAENIPPLLGGAVMQAVLSGRPLPRLLLSAVIARIRADGEVNGPRAAICKAVISRTTDLKGRPLVSLDPDNDDPAYCLGRLFAAYAYAEQSFAKRNATIRDRYLAGASTTPARVFPLLMRGYERNRSGLMKAQDQRRGAGVKADKAVSAILERIDLGSDLPASLPLEAQGRFFIGFYHQWNAFFTKTEEAAEAAADTGDDE